MDLLETSGNEHRHPWELSRGDCIFKLVMSEITNEHRIIADIGCGDLYFSNILTNELDRTIFAIDTSFTDLYSDNEKIIKMNSLSRLDDGCIDIAILMDVLEHVENPTEFLSLLSSKMSGGGVMLFTVPAFQHLFSEHDVFLKHYRRYSRKSLSTELSSAGILIDRIFYFYSALYVPRLTQIVTARLKQKTIMAHNISAWKYDENEWITKLVRNILNLDFNFNKKFCKLLPFGLSICAICKKMKG